jgi:Sulfotransferase family
MLQQALNRHSQIVIPPETKYFFSFVGCSKLRQVQQIQRINADLQINLPVPAKKIISRSDACMIFDQMAFQYLRRLGRSGVAYFGDKTPEQTSRLARIRWLFPAAKFIFIYRDGRDVALSLSKVPWMDKDPPVNFIIWLYYYRILLKIQKDAGLDLHCVKYEDLVTDSVGEFRRILEFLQLPYEPAVSEGYGNTEGIPLREYAWKRRALEPITNERIGSWRFELSAVEIAFMESIGQSALASLGYDIRTRSSRRIAIGATAKLIVKVTKLLYRLPWQQLAAEILGGPC